MKEVIYNGFAKFGLFALGGLIGAVIHRFRTKMSLKRFISSLFISSFIGLSIGILLRNYFSAPDEVIFVACSVGGVFSNDILDQIGEVISFLGEFIKNLLKKKAE